MEVEVGSAKVESAAFGEEAPEVGYHGLSTSIVDDGRVRRVGEVPEVAEEE